MTGCESFVDLVDRLTRIAYAAQFAHGLNPAQWEALRFLSKANRYSASPGALAEYLGTTKGTASQTLIALESKGLVLRQRIDCDRRKLRLVITDAGRALLQRDPLRLIDQAVCDLPEEARQSMMKTMRDVIDRVCLRQGGARFGMCTTCCHRRGPGEGRCREGESICGLTSETLDESEQERICVNFISAC